MKALALFWLLYWLTQRNMFVFYVGVFERVLFFFQSVLLLFFKQNALWINTYCLASVFTPLAIFFDGRYSSIKTGIFQHFSPSYWHPLVAHFTAKQTKSVLRYVFLMLLIKQEKTKYHEMSDNCFTQTYLWRYKK